jgi:hypothetical protein
MSAQRSGIDCRAFLRLNLCRRTSFRPSDAGAREVLSSCVRRKSAFSIIISTDSCDRSWSEKTRLRSDGRIWPVLRVVPRNSIIGVINKALKCLRAANLANPSGQIERRT